MLYVHPTAYRYDGGADPSRPGGMADIYRPLAADEQRTRQVTADVLAALAENRHCLVLTNRTSHLEQFAGLLHEAGHDPIILRGGMGAKSRAAALARLQPQPGGPPLPAVAIGPYAGEGFDCPALDTPVPRRTGRQQGQPDPVRMPDPALAREQDHGRSPRLTRRADRRPRRHSRQTRARLHRPRLSRPPQDRTHPSASMDSYPAQQSTAASTVPGGSKSTSN